MRIGAFELNEPVPELNDPHVFAMIRPWVDVGSVGTLTLNRLERYLGSTELGKLARPGNFFDFTRYRPTMKNVDGRSEEHTSELQSRTNLVCRLLLEKKKKPQYLHYLIIPNIPDTPYSPHLM